MVVAENCIIINDSVTHLYAPSGTWDIKGACDVDPSGNWRSFSAPLPWGPRDAALCPVRDGVRPPAQTHIVLRPPSVCELLLEGRGLALHYFCGSFSDLSSVCRWFLWCHHQRAEVDHSCHNLSTLAPFFLFQQCSSQAWFFSSFIQAVRHKLSLLSKENKETYFCHVLSPSEQEKNKMKPN